MKSHKDTDLNSKVEMVNGFVKKIKDPDLSIISIIQSFFLKKKNLASQKYFKIESVNFQTESKSALIETVITGDPLHLTCGLICNCFNRFIDYFCKQFGKCQLLRLYKTHACVESQYIY